MTGSFLNKVSANLWLLLNDYGTGEFPPQKTQREIFLEDERNQFKRITFETAAQRHERDMRKPFGFSFTPTYLRSIATLMEEMQKRGIKPPAKVLELGCGSGWLLEMLVQHGYAAQGTTIIADDVASGEMRTESFKIKKLPADLKFMQTEMEAVHKHFRNEFDVAIFHEALHHAFDWREALEAATVCLKPGGWLILANEPSWLHTFVCYRSAQIFRTLEIGFRRRDLKNVLQKLGYQNVKITQPLFFPGIKGVFARVLPFLLIDNSIQSRSFWVYAQKSK